MSQLSPAELRLQLSILDEGDAIEDAQLQGYIDAAWVYCGKYTRRDLSAEYPTDVPADLKQAQTMLAAHYYRHREAGSEEDVSAVPFGVKDLLADYRSYS